MGKKNIINNFFYNCSYQILLIILPIITMPYVSRVLGPQGLGQFAYTFSIVQYLSIIAYLGILSFGNREIASVRNFPEKRDKVFWNIFYILFLSGFLLFLIYLIVISSLEIKYKSIFFAQSLNILAVAFDISWFFMGNEDFKKIVLRNAAVKICGVILIFSVIKTPQDLWAYTLILSSTIFLGNLTFWAYLPHYKVKFCPPDFSYIKNIFKPLLVIFLPNIPTQIYLLFPRIFMGFLNLIKDVAYFDLGYKVIQVILSFSNSLGIVLFPRLSNTAANGDMVENRKYFNYAVLFTCAISLPTLIMLFIVSEVFINWFLGRDFLPTANIIRLISIIIFILPLRTLFASQVLSMRWDKKINVVTFMGAGINVILSLILIPKFNYWGAGVAMIVTEVSMFLYLFFQVKQFLDINIINQEFTRIFFGLFTLISMFFIGYKFVYTSKFYLALFVIFNIILYITVLYSLKSECTKVIFNRYLKWN